MSNTNSNTNLNKKFVLRLKNNMKKTTTDEAEETNKQIDTIIAQNIISPENNAIKKDSQQKSHEPLNKIIEDIVDNNANDVYIDFLSSKLDNKNMDNETKENFTNFVEETNKERSREISEKENKEKVFNNLAKTVKTADKNPFNDYLKIYSLPQELKGENDIRDAIRDGKIFGKYLQHLVLSGTNIKSKDIILDDGKIVINPDAVNNDLNKENNKMLIKDEVFDKYLHTKEDKEEIKKDEQATKSATKSLKQHGTFLTKDNTEDPKTAIKLIISSLTQYVNYIIKNDKNWMNSVFDFDSEIAELEKQQEENNKKIQKLENSKEKLEQNKNKDINTTSELQELDAKIEELKQQNVEKKGQQEITQFKKQRITIAVNKNGSLNADNIMKTFSDIRQYIIITVLNKALCENNYDINDIKKHFSTKKQFEENFFKEAKVNKNDFENLKNKALDNMLMYKILNKAFNNIDKVLLDYNEEITKTKNEISNMEVKVKRLKELKDVDQKRASNWFSANNELTKKRIHLKTLQESMKKTQRTKKNMKTNIDPFYAQSKDIVKLIKDKKYDELKKLLGKKNLQGYGYIVNKENIMEIESEINTLFSPMDEIANILMIPFTSGREEFAEQMQQNLNFLNDILYIYNEFNNAFDKSVNESKKQTAKQGDKKSENVEKIYFEQLYSKVNIMKKLRVVAAETKKETLPARIKQGMEKISELCNNLKQAEENFNKIFNKNFSKVEEHLKKLLNDKKYVKRNQVISEFLKNNEGYNSKQKIQNLFSMIRTLDKYLDDQQESIYKPVRNELDAILDSSYKFFVSSNKVRGVLNHEINSLSKSLVVSCNHQLDGISEHFDKRKNSIKDIMNHLEADNIKNLDKFLKKNKLNPADYSFSSNNFIAGDNSCDSRERKIFNMLIAFAPSHNDDKKIKAIKQAFGDGFTDFSHDFYNSAMSRGSAFVGNIIEQCKQKVKNIETMDDKKFKNYIKSRIDLYMNKVIEYNKFREKDLKQIKTVIINNKDAKSQSYEESQSYEYRLNNYLEDIDRIIDKCQDNIKAAQNIKKACQRQIEKAVIDCANLKIDRNKKIKYKLKQSVDQNRVPQDRNNKHKLNRDTIIAQDQKPITEEQIKQLRISMKQNKTTEHKVPVNNDNNKVKQNRQLKNIKFNNYLDLYEKNRNNQNGIYSQDS